MGGHSGIDPQEALAAEQQRRAVGGGKLLTAQHRRGGLAGPGEEAAVVEARVTVCGLDRADAEDGDLLQRAPEGRDGLSQRDARRVVGPDAAVDQAQAA